jgi:ubiquitin-conjugating enzyme E2 S
MGVGIGMASTAGMGGVTGTKAVKRAATGSGVSGAEKRKKALKRL